MNVSYTTQFKKDLKKVKKRRKDLSKLSLIIRKISQGRRLEARYKNHKLVGNYLGRYECHIEPDWLLIYLINNDDVVFERTGSHSDLFK